MDVSQPAINNHNQLSDKTKNSPSQTRDVFDSTVTVLCWIIWANKLYCSKFTKIEKLFFGFSENLESMKPQNLYIYPSGGKSVE